MSTLEKVWVKCRLCSKRRKLVAGNRPHLAALCFECWIAEEDKKRSEATEAARVENERLVQEEVDDLVEHFGTIHFSATKLSDKLSPRKTCRLNHDSAAIYITRGIKPGEATAAIRVGDLTPQAAFALAVAAEHIGSAPDADIVSACRGLQNINVDLRALVREHGSAIDASNLDRALQTLESFFGK